MWESASGIREAASQRPLISRRASAHISFTLAALQNEEKVCGKEGRCTLVEKRRLVGVDMNIINAQLVLPLTRCTQLSLAEHVGGRAPHFFISHTWGGSFRNYVATVQKHYEK